MSATRRYSREVSAPAVKNFNRHELLQDEILRKTKIDCSIVITETEISIRLKNSVLLRDYIFAKDAIKHLAGSLPIKWDIPT